MALMLVALPPALANAQALDGTLQKIKTSGTFTAPRGVRWKPTRPTG
jgi:hypothetical protein